MTDASRGAHEAVLAARVRRRPVDLYEASVALEAWGGVRAGEAFELAESVAHSPALGALPVADHEAAAEPPGAAAGIASALLIPVAVSWADPIGAATAAPVSLVLAVLVPFTFAVGAIARARYRRLPGSRLLGLGRDLPGFALLGASLGVVALVTGVTTVIAAGVAVTLIACALLVERGWPGIAGAIAGVTGVLLFAGAPAADAVILSGAFSLMATGVAWTTSGDDGIASPSPARGAAAAGGIGVLLGAMVVIDPAARAAGGAALALVLVPSAVAAYWSGLGLGDLHRAIQGAATDADPRAPRSLVVRVAGRYVVASTALSLVGALAAPSPAVAVLLAGVAVAGLLASATSLLDSLGSPVVGVLCAALGVLVALAVGSFGAPPGLPLLSGAGVAAGVAFAAIHRALGRPASLLATRLSIP